MSKVIAPFLFIAVSLGLFFTYIDPAYKVVQELVALRNELEEALNNSTELRKVREERNNQFNSFEPTDLARLQKLLPDSVDNVRLIIELDTIASKYGVAMRNFSFSEESPAATAAQPGESEAPPKPYGTASFSFAAQATHADFVAFLSEIESSLRLADVRELTVATDRGAEDKAGHYNYTVMLNTYWLP